MSCTALVVYSRWAVDDPVLDCAIWIVDKANYAEMNKKEYDFSDVVTEDLSWPTDMWSTSMSLRHAADFVKSIGKTGYVWTDEHMMLAHEILERLSLIAWHEYMIEGLIGKLDRKCEREETTT